MSKCQGVVLKILLTINLVLLAIKLISYNVTYATFPKGCLISEFLINYQGGFVRRGLVGELLYRMCEPLGMNPTYIIVPVCIVAFSLFIYLIIMYFKKEHLCLWILPTYYVLGGADYIRKDFIIMLFVFWIFQQVPKFLAGSNNVAYMILMFVLLLNIHEASFFIVYPTLCVYILFAKYNRATLWARTAMIVAPLMMMLALCVFKGSEECCNNIFDSWDYAYPDALKSLEGTQNSITALTWETWPTIQWHLHLNFATGAFFKYSPLIIKPLAISMILWLMVQISFFHHRNSAEYSSRTGKFVFHAILQLISLAPMFTILSCDFRRICFYWTTSSFLAYFCLNGLPLKSSFIEKIQSPIKRLGEIVSKAVSPVYPFALLLLLGVPYIVNPPVGYMSPIGQEVLPRVFVMPRT